MARGPAPRPIRGPSGFASVLKLGARCRVGMLRGYADRLSDAETCSLGVSVPRSRVRRATDRNRYKRIVRASARDAAVVLGGLRIVVIVDGPARAPRAAAPLHRDLARLWHELSAAVARQNRDRSP